MRRLYAYAVEEDEIIAFTIGKCSAEAVRHLYVKVKLLDIDVLLTDKWEAFTKCTHLIGKVFPKSLKVPIQFMGLSYFFTTSHLILWLLQVFPFHKSITDHVADMHLAIFYPAIVRIINCNNMVS